MDGGGAIFVRGGRFKDRQRAVLSTTAAPPPGPTSAARRCTSSRSSTGNPVYIVNSTFGGADGPAQRVLERRRHLEHRRVVDDHQQPVPRQPRHRHRREPAQTGTPGGGNGGAIYNDGNTMTLRVAGTRIEDNTSNGEGGSAIFFVSNDRTGTVEIVDSVIRDNTGDGFETHPGIFFLGARIRFVNSIVE